LTRILARHIAERNRAAKHAATHTTLSRRKPEGTMTKSAEALPSGNNLVAIAACPAAVRVANARSLGKGPLWLQTPRQPVKWARWGVAMGAAVVGGGSGSPERDRGQESAASHEEERRHDRVEERPCVRQQRPHQTARQEPENRLKGPGIPAGPERGDAKPLGVSSRHAL